MDDDRHKPALRALKAHRGTTIRAAVNDRIGIEPQRRRAGPSLPEGLATTRRKCSSYFSPLGSGCSENALSIPSSSFLYSSIWLFTLAERQVLLLSPR